MILDTSAIVAIIFQEPGYELLLQKLTAMPLLCVGDDFPQTDIPLA
jgi:uncharacterized protein with PIN domain